MRVDPERPESVIQIENKEFRQGKPVVECRRSNGCILERQRVRLLGPNHLKALVQIYRKSRLVGDEMYEN